MKWAGGGCSVLRELQPALEQGIDVHKEVKFVDLQYTHRYTGRYSKRYTKQYSKYYTGSLSAGR